MEKPELLRKLEMMLDQIERERMWGNIEIEFREGAPVLIRKSATERIDPRETPNGQRRQR